MKARILVVDDEENIRALIQSRLDQEGYHVVTAIDTEDALKKYGQPGEVAVLVTDIRLPGRDGFELIREMSHRNSSLKTIVITGVTGHGRKEEAILAVRAGVSDYFEKPLNMNDLSVAVERCLKEYRESVIRNEGLARIGARLRKIEGKQEDTFWYVSKARSMDAVNHQMTSLRRDAVKGGSKESSVLIIGEPGSGQGTIARMIHAGSSRAKGPWVSLNCWQFSLSELESELFGQERTSHQGEAAVTYGLLELAQGGTLLLENVSALEYHLQEKLLSILQKRSFSRVGGRTEIEFDVRIISTVHPDIRSRIQEGRFHEGLYRLLSRTSMELPALHDRAEDILPMAAQFAQQSFRSLGKAFVGFTPGAESALRAYRWPGNMTELFHLVERAALLADSGSPVPEQCLFLRGQEPEVRSGYPRLQLVASSGPSASQNQTLDTPTGRAQGLDLSSGLRGVQDLGDASVGYTEIKKRWSDSFEKDYLINILNRFSGNVSAAARQARLDRSNFLRLLRRHGLKAERYRKAA